MIQTTWTTLREHLKHIHAHSAFYLQLSALPVQVQHKVILENDNISLEWQFSVWYAL